MFDIYCESIIQELHIQKLGTAFIPSYHHSSQVRSRLQIGLLLSYMAFCFEEVARGQLDALSLGKHERHCHLRPTAGSAGGWCSLARCALNLYITLHLLREANVEQCQIRRLGVELSFLHTGQQVRTKVVNFTVQFTETSKSWVFWDQACM